MALAAALAIAAFFVFSGGGKDDDETEPAASSGATCAYRPNKGNNQTAQHLKDVGTPPGKPDTTSTLRATIKTNLGDIVIDLDNKRAACTVNSMRYLAGKSFFGKTQCHRLVTDQLKVLQCGDPSGTGMGGPAYTYDDENLPGSTYTRGTVAMANAGPGTNGSQFFLVYGPTPIEPTYTVFGRITKGLDIVDKVAKAGAIKPSDGSLNTPPKMKVMIEDLTVS